MENIDKTNQTYNEIKEVLRSDIDNINVNTGSYKEGVDALGSDLTTFGVRNKT